MTASAVGGGATAGVPGFARALALFLGVFAASLLLLPAIAIGAHSALPGTLENLLFFWPQMVMPAYGLESRAASGQLVLSGTASVICAAVWWLLASVAFAWLARRQGAWAVFVLAIPAILVIGIASLLFLAALGYTPNFEGP